MAINKWRPSFKCIYVVSEIHGQLKNLKNVLKRILPLRKFKGQEDVVFFMGDYIDGTENASEVLDLLIDVKTKYPDRSFFLRGNHEDLLLKSLNSSSEYNYWMQNGGYSTVFGYLKNSNNKDPRGLPYHRLNDIIPKDHINFIKETRNYIEYEQYLFFHGGIDFKKNIEDTNESVFLYDKTCSMTFKESIVKKQELKSVHDKILIGSHNFNSEKPFIHQKYFMLGENKGERLFVIDLNSMQMCSVKNNKNHVFPYDFDYYE